MFVDKKFLIEASEALWESLGKVDAKTEIRGVSFPVPRSERERLLALDVIADQANIGYRRRGRTWPLLYLLPRSLQEESADKVGDESPEPESRLILYLLIAILVPIIGPFLVTRALARIVTRKLFRWSRTGRFSSWLATYLYWHATFFEWLSGLVLVLLPIVGIIITTMVTFSVDPWAGLGTAAVFCAWIFGVSIFYVIQVFPAYRILKRSAIQVSREIVWHHVGEPEDRGSMSADAIPPDGASGVNQGLTERAASESSGHSSIAAEAVQADDAGRVDQSIPEQATRTCPSCDEANPTERVFCRCGYPL